MFRLPVMAIEWSKGIFKQEPFMLQFDIYYLFFLTGLVAHDSRILIADDGGAIHQRDVIDSFPQDYNSSQKLIINLLLITEKNRRAIPDNDKTRLRSELLEKYINPENNSLTTEGFKLANSYAYGGSQILDEKIAPPRDPADFMIAFLKVLRDVDKF